MSKYFQSGIKWIQPIKEDFNKKKEKDISEKYKSNKFIEASAKSGFNAKIFLQKLINYYMIIMYYII